MNMIQTLIQSDAQRTAAVEVVASLNLPDCFIAAGFVRNRVWDFLHGYEDTPLNDVDVIYFDKSEILKPEHILDELQKLLPKVNWQVKNQAMMHSRNGDRPYLNSEDAMTFWPEKETAVGVRLAPGNSLEVSAPFGLCTLLSGHITHNPKRQKSVFVDRVQSKGWLQKWPRLKVVS